MNIVLTLNQYHKLTGSELYVYELARTLKKRGHTVTILSNYLGGEIAERTRLLTIPMYYFFDHPELTPDIVHSSQPNPTGYALRFFPKATHVVTIHSQLSYEKPVRHENIKRYIFVRPEIASLYSDLPGAMIWNGVDPKRFNTKGTTDNGKVLVVGTPDHLRAKMVTDLHNRGYKLMLVGGDWLGDGKPNDTWNVETFTKECHKTAGIYIGRTTIEGWMCGKPGIVYDVDEQGNIKQVEEISVPDDLSSFTIDTMTDQVLKVYKEASES